MTSSGKRFTLCASLLLAPFRAPASAGARFHFQASFPFINRQSARLFDSVLQYDCNLIDIKIHKVKMIHRKCEEK